MDQNPDPDDRLRGRPPGRTRKVMNVSLAIDVYNALMKISEGQRSSFISDVLKPLTSQFDPGPSSYLALSLKQLVDSAISESKKENDYQKLAAVSSLANEVMPKLEPYLELCKESDSTQRVSEELPQESSEIAGIVDSIRIARALKKLESLLQSAETIHRAVPLRYHNEQYEKRLEETKVASEAVRRLLGRYGDYLTEEQVFKNIPQGGPEESGILTKLKTFDPEDDFRKGLPMHDIVKGCRKVTEDAKQILDEETRGFVTDTCSFVDNSVRRSWGAGIDIQMSSYSIHPEKGTFLVTLYNRGQYGASIHGVKCDGDAVTFHASLKSGNHLPAHEESVVEVRPCIGISKKPTHTVTFEIEFLEFSFELTA
ncbi:MAG: hypothetical protein KGI33_00010 [Thaumarchaeota archaeon]|nr:hypothetical protein [Nitrososphaerota archaeon]